MDRPVGLGSLSSGDHRLSIGLAADPTPLAVTSAEVERAEVEVVGSADPSSLPLRHAPILLGRTEPHLGPRFQNTTTDAPLLSWHGVRPGRRRDLRILEYSVLWSTRTRGTDARALMARWGRTTDIGWIYRVEVDRLGRRVPGTARYQGAGHTALPFDGPFEDEHPRLQTSTGNNMVAPATDGAMRFALAPVERVPAGVARERVMLRHPVGVPDDGRRAATCRADRGSRSPRSGRRPEELPVRRGTRGARVSPAGAWSSGSPTVPCIAPIVVTPTSSWRAAVRSVPQPGCRTVSTIARSRPSGWSGSGRTSRTECGGCSFSVGDPNLLSSRTL